MGNAGGINVTAVGVAIGFGVLAILFTIGIVQVCCRHRCHKCKKAFRRKKSKKDKVLTKVGSKKTPPPFSISGVTIK